MAAKSKRPLVAIVMGSQSDWPVLKEAKKALDQFGIKSIAKVVSAHRTPKEMVDFATHARANGISVIIAGAGGAAHLPGMIASLTELPVIGVPVALKELQGLDSLLSIAQMPRGIVVATVAINGAQNAGILAAQMLGLQDGRILNQVSKMKESLRRKVKKQKLGK